MLIGFQITTKRLCHFDQVDKKTDGQFRKMPEMRSKLTSKFLHNLRRVALAAVTRLQLLIHNPCHHRGHPHHNHHRRHHWNANCSQKRGEFGLLLLLGGAPDESGRHAPLYFRTRATRARFVIYNLWFLIVNLQFAICESQRHAVLFFALEPHCTAPILSLSREFYFSGPRELRPPPLPVLAEVSLKSICYLTCNTFLDCKLFINWALYFNCGFLGP